MQKKEWSISIRSNALKLSLFFVVMLMAACSPAHMVKKDGRLDIRTITPDPGKSALVIARTTSFGGGVNFFTYVDRKFIGVTRGEAEGTFLKSLPTITVI